MKNTTAKVIYYLGVVVIVIGVVLGCMVGQDRTDPLNPVLHWSTVITWSAAGFVCGIILVGISEIINLLQGIYNRLGNKG